MEQPYRYRAFISYSHADEAWAKWLHRALESYRVPARLRRGDRADLPKRLLPIFRDRDELPSAAELGSVIQEALRQSEALIVICSPRAVGSRWVNEEIRYFKSLGRGGQVLALIVDGEPHAGEAAQECFPQALRFGVLADGTVGGDAIEPIAADAREGRDGRKQALLKLIAGLLGVGFDELVQRERQRQFWQRVQQGAAALAVLALVASAWQWFEHYKAAQAHELRVEQLYQQGRQALLAQQSGQAALYLTAALREGRDTPALRFMLGQAMQAVEGLSPLRMQVEGRVTHPTFTPDDTRVIVPAVGEQGTTATVFELATGRALQTLKGLPAAPQIVEVLPDGQRVLISGLAQSEPRLRKGAETGIWDVQSGQRLLTLPGHAGLFGRPMPSDGERLLTADGRQPTEVQICDARSGDVLHRLRSATPMRAASFSTSGEWVLTGDDSGKVRLWQAATGRLQAELAGSALWPVAGIQITPDGQKAIAVSEVGDVRVWRIPDGELLLAFAADKTFVSDVRLDAAGRQLLTIGQQGYKVWTLQRGTLVFARNTELDWYGAGDLQPGGGTLATVTSNDQQIHFYEVASRQLRSVLEPASSVLTAAAFSHSGKKMLMGALNGELRLLQAIPGPLLDLAHPKEVYAATFNPDGRAIATVGAEGPLRVWDAVSGALRLTLPGHRGQVWDVQYDASGQHLTTVGADGQLRFWNADSGALLASEAAHAAGIFKLIQSADHTLAIAVPYPSGHQDFTATVWSLGDGRLRHRLQHPAIVRHASFTSDGRQVATACADGQVRLWSLDDGRLLASFKLSDTQLISVAISADGKSLLAVDIEHSAQVISLPQGERLTRLDLDTGDAPTFGAAAPDNGGWAVATLLGRIWFWQQGQRQWREALESRLPIDDLDYLGPELLISNGQDGQQRVWDTARQQLLAVVGGHDIRALSMTRDPSNSKLLTTGYDGRARLWPMAPERRAAATLQALLACRLPQSLDDNDRLHPNTLSACAP